MRTFQPLPPEGVSAELHRQRAADVVREEMKKISVSGKKLRALGVDYRCITGRSNFSRQSIAAILALPRLSTAAAARLRIAFFGRQPQRCREYLHEHLFFHESLQQLATRVGKCTATNLQFMVRGQKIPHTNKRRQPIFPDFPTWNAIASAILLDADMAYAMWQNDVREHFTSLGYNPQAVEIESILMQRGMTMQHVWREWGSAPEHGLSCTVLGSSLSALRRGVLQPWPLVRDFCLRMAMKPQEQEKLTIAIVRTFLEHCPSIRSLQWLTDWKQKIEPQAISVALRAYTAGEDMNAALKALARKFDADVEQHTRSAVCPLANAMVSEEMKAFFGRTIPPPIEKLRQFFLDCAELELRRYGTGEFGVRKTREELRRIFRIQSGMDHSRRRQKSLFLTSSTEEW